MVTIEQLAAKYPLLWHMADPRNLSGILKRGMMATSALLDLLGLDKAERSVHERERRPDEVVFEHDEHGTIVLRDQKPLSMARLTGALTEGTPSDFLAFINGRVFFWPTEERLKTMNAARAYRERAQLVFVVRTVPMLNAYADRVRLSRINSGATMPYAFERSIETFQRLEDYDWSGGKRQVAEVTIEGGVSNIWAYVERLDIWQNGERLKTLKAPYDETLLRRVKV
jgi:hypothetical protein